MINFLGNLWPFYGNSNQNHNETNDSGQATQNKIKDYTLDAKDLMSDFEFVLTTAEENLIKDANGGYSKLRQDLKNQKITSAQIVSKIHELGGLYNILHGKFENQVKLCKIQVAQKETEDLTSQIKDTLVIWQKFYNAYLSSQVKQNQNVKGSHILSKPTLRFAAFDVDQALKQIGMPALIYDSDIGLFGLDCLSKAALKDFENYNQRLKIAELKVYLEASKALEQNKKDLADLLLLNDASAFNKKKEIIKSIQKETEKHLEAKYYKESSVSLAKPEFWNLLKTLNQNNNNSQKSLEKQQKDWLQHAPYAHYTAAGLWDTYECLQAFQSYCNNANEELINLANQINNRAQKFNFLLLPNALRQQNISTKNYQNFFNIYSDYLDLFQQQIIGYKEILKEAILARLNLANRKMNISDDNILYDKITELRDSKIFPLPSPNFFDPPSTLTIELFYRLHCCLAEYDQTLCQSNWSWFQSSLAILKSNKNNLQGTKLGIDFTFDKWGDVFFLLPKENNKYLRTHLTTQEGVNVKASDQCFQLLVQYNMAMHEYAKNYSDDVLAKAINHFIHLEKKLPDHISDNPIRIAWRSIVDSQNEALSAVALEKIQKWLQILQNVSLDTSVEPQLTISPVLLAALWKFPVVEQAITSFYQDLLGVFKNLVENESFLKGSNKLNKWLDLINACMTTKETKEAFKLIQRMIIEKQFLEIPQFISAIKTLTPQGSSANSNYPYWRKIVLDLIKQTAGKNDIFSWSWLAAYQRQVENNLGITEAWIQNNLNMLTLAVSYLKSVFSVEGPEPEVVLVDGNKMAVKQSIMGHCYQTLQEATNMHPKFSVIINEVDLMIKEYINKYDGSTAGYLVFLPLWSAKRHEALLAQYVAKNFNAVFQKHPKFVLEEPFWMVMNGLKKEFKAVAAELSQSLLKLLIASQPNAQQMIFHLYPSLAQPSNSDDAKAPGLNDRKLVNIRNMDKLAIVQPRELWHCQNSKVEPGWGIISTDADLLETLLEKYLLPQERQALKSYLDKVIKGWLNEDWSLLRQGIFHQFAPLQDQQAYQHKWLQQLLTDVDFAKQHPDPYEQVDFFKGPSTGSPLTKLGQLYGSELTTVFKLMESFINAPQVNEPAWNMLYSIFMITDLPLTEKKEKFYETFNSLKARFNLIYKIKDNLDKEEGLVYNLKHQNYKEALSQFFALDSSIVMSTIFLEKMAGYFRNYVCLSIKEHLKSYNSSSDKNKFNSEFLKKLPKEYQATIDLGW